MILDRPEAASDHAAAAAPGSTLREKVAIAIALVILGGFAFFMLSDSKRSPAGPSTSSAFDAPKEPAWKVVRHQGKAFAVTVPKERESERALYQSALNSLCTSGAPCLIDFYAGSVRLPKDMFQPSAAEFAKITVRYQGNGPNDPHAFLWNCRLYNVPTECFTPD